MKEKPIQLLNPNFVPVIERAQEYLDFFDSEDFHEDRIEKYETPIVEAVLEALYGPDVYDWINEQFE